MSHIPPWLSSAWIYPEVQLLRNTALPTTNPHPKNATSRPIPPRTPTVPPTRPSPNARPSSRPHLIHAHKILSSLQQKVAQSNTSTHLERRPGRTAHTLPRLSFAIPRWQTATPSACFFRPFCPACAWVASGYCCALREKGARDCRAGKSPGEKGMRFASGRRADSGP